MHIMSLGPGLVHSLFSPNLTPCHHTIVEASEKPRYCTNYGQWPVLSIQTTTVLTFSTLIHARPRRVPFSFYRICFRAAMAGHDVLHLAVTGALALQSRPTGHLITAEMGSCTRHASLSLTASTTHLD